VIFLIKTFYFSYDLIDTNEEKYIEETFKSSDEKNDFLIKAKNILINNNEEKELIIENKEKKEED